MIPHVFFSNPPHGVLKTPLGIPSKKFPSPLSSDQKTTRIGFNVIFCLDYLAMSEDVFHVQKSFGCRKKINRTSVVMVGGFWVSDIYKCLVGANSFEPVKRSFFLGVKIL